MPGLQRETLVSLRTSHDLAYTVSSMSVIAPAAAYLAACRPYVVQDEPALIPAHSQRIELLGGRGRSGKDSFLACLLLLFSSTASVAQHDAEARPPR